MSVLNTTSGVPSSTGTRMAPGGALVAEPRVVIDCYIKELHYGTFKAVRDTKVPIAKNAITAFIGPSGCGKSTVLRCLNRMNDLVRGFRFEGHVRYRGTISTSPASIRSPSAGSSGWSSSNRIRLRRPSTTTSRSDCA